MALPEHKAQHVKHQAKHAIVLAAGRGSRLGAMTDNLPKCLAVVAGRALLDWMLESLFGAGVERVLIVSGYCNEGLARFRSSQVEIVHNAQWEHANMLATLCCARDWLVRHPCVITYSDIAVRSQHIARLGAIHSDLAIANNLKWQSLWATRFEAPLVDAETFSAVQGQLKSIGARAQHLDEIGGQFMGLVKTTPIGWAALDSILMSDPNFVRDGDTTKLLARALAQRVVIDVVDCAGGWIEIDSQSDADLVETALSAARSSGPWPHDWRT
jgi:L-glutamine-phosphate cytidylyltransferase